MSLDLNCLYNYLFHVSDRYVDFYSPLVVLQYLFSLGILCGFVNFMHEVCSLATRWQGKFENGLIS